MIDAGYSPDPHRGDAAGGNWSDVVVAAVVCCLLTSGLLWFAFRYNAGADATLLMLAGLFGVALGWIAGILASPYSDRESAAFTHISKLIYGFLTGYAVSKLDPLVNRLTGVGATTPLPERPLVLAAFAITCFLVAVAVTYVTRSYWVDEQLAKASKQGVGEEPETRGKP